MLGTMKKRAKPYPLRAYGIGARDAREDVGNGVFYYPQSDLLVKMDGQGEAEWCIAGRYFPTQIEITENAKARGGRPNPENIRVAQWYERRFEKRPDADFSRETQFVRRKLAAAIAGQGVR